MTSGVSRDFQDNGMDMGITPILPPEVNSVAQLASPNVSAFSRAVKNEVEPQGPSILSAVSNNNDGQRRATDAIGVGQNLNARDTVGMQVKQSDASYLGSQVGQAVSQVATGLSSILGAEGASAQKVREGAELEEQDQKPAAPPPQMTLPSVTGGMASGPGGR